MAADPSELAKLVQTTDAVPPALRYRLAEVVALLSRAGGEGLDGVAAERAAKIFVDGNGWFGAVPALAELGYWMIAPARAPEIRVRGCAWLAMFPTALTMARLAALARDPATPPPVRDAAIDALGARQLRAHHPATLWSRDAIEIADDALARLADAASLDGTAAANVRLAHAARHVGGDLMLAVFARYPGMWGDALECFCSPPLARVLCVSLDDIPAQHRLRVLRLVGATLGEEAVPLFVHRARDVGLEERIELLLLAVGLGGEAHLPRLEDAIAGVAHGELIRGRARWHLANRGVVPTVRALQTARATATIPAADRTARCARAADDLAALAKLGRHPEAYLYTLWGWMVRGAGDPARAAQLVGAHPESQRLVRDLYVEDLARRGRVRQLAATAQALGIADAGALALAIWGRPLAALELAATARAHTPELVCARALACHRAGRADLAERILVEDLPPSEVCAEGELAPFPGPNERWLIEHAPGERPAIAALARGRAGVIDLARPAPSEDAEPDAPTLAPIDAVVRRLGRGLAGKAVYLAGEFAKAERTAIAAAAVAAGARLVGGPFPGTDYYVHGDRCLAQTIAQLERQGARRLRPGELAGI